MRLITIGCSNTYGHCLPDCSHYEPVSKTWGCGDKPSRFAFPQLLADRLGCELHNLSWPGASNRHIWWQSLNFEFDKDDVVILVWTFSNRHALIMPHMTQHLGCWPSALPANRNFQKFVASANSQLDLEITSFLYMDHTLNHLNGRVKKLLNYRVDDKEYNDIPDWCNIKFVDTLNLIVPHDEKDFAEDGIHYGIESHKKFAVKMFEDLTTDSN